MRLCMFRCYGHRGGATGSVMGSERAMDRAGSVGVVDAFISYSHAADGLLAPRLQAGLQRFAKPWWRRRALRVFRDESSLSANPHLWSSITAALDSAEWFVLLLSPEAAASPWVDREVEYWLEHRDPRRILPVLTEGRFVWDEAAGAVHRASSVPPSLLGAFTEEPRWVDLRWARDETQLDLRDSRFRGAVADVASAVRGVPKDDLESEEVRQHRRTVRTAWAAGVALAVLATTAGVAAVYANGQRREAEAQRVVAEEQTAIAIANQARAVEQTALAESAGQLARSRELAASAINVLGNDPELSILLGLEAIDAAPDGDQPPLESMAALRRAVHSNKLVRREQVAPGGWVYVAVAPDGSRVLVTSEQTNVARMLDAETWDVLWEYSNPGTVDTLNFGGISPRSDVVFVSYVDSTSTFAGYFPEGGVTDDDLPARVEVLDAGTGELLHTLAYPDCPTSFGLEFSSDGGRLSVMTGSDPVDGWCGTWRTEYVDTGTWQVQGVIDQGLVYGVADWSEDDSRIILSTPGTVFDGETYEELFAAPDQYGSLGPDGTTFVGMSDDGMALEVRKPETGELLDRLHGFEFAAQDFDFTTDGSMIVAVTGGAETLVWDWPSGELRHRLPTTGAGASFEFDASNRLLYHTNTDGQLTVWDLGGTAAGETNTTITDLQLVPNSMSVAGSAATAGDHRRRDPGRGLRPRHGGGHRTGTFGGVVQHRPRRRSRAVHGSAGWFRRAGKRARSGGAVGPGDRHHHRARRMLGVVGRVLRG